MTKNAVNDVSEPVSQTFRFHRYHAELLRRKNLELRNEQVGDCCNDKGLVNRNILVVNEDMSKNHLRNAFALLSTTPSGVKTNILENLINCMIVVDEDGNINRVGGSSHKMDHCFPLHVDLEMTLLLRNIQNSRIEIRNHLPALHIVNVHHTQIHVQSVVESAIHVTKAIDSDLFIKYPARQLRIHQAIRLQVTLGQQPEDNQQSPAAGTTTRSTSVGWNPGSIILEHSKHATFYVPAGAIREGSSFPLPTNSVWMSIIKDFGWLRTSVPSPNFSIQGIAATDLQHVDLPRQQAQHLESDTHTTNTSVSESELNVLPTSKRVSDEDNHDEDDEL
jgi:hypothetical protein